MKTFLAAATAAATTIIATAPVQAQDSSRSYQAYGIIDVQTNVGKDPIIIAIDRAVRGYASDLQSNRPIMVQTPEEPLRFELVNPLESSGMGAFSGLAQMAGVSPDQMQIATCKGAVWTSLVQRNISGSQSLKVWFCLFPYASAEKRGFQLNYYAQDSADAGGSIRHRVQRSINNRIVGSPREWTERMIRSSVAALEDSAGVQGVLIEGEPEVPHLFRPRAEPAAISVEQSEGEGGGNGN